MIANVGSADRLVRIVAGIALIALFFFVPQPWNYVGLVAGIVLALTGIFRFCGLYKVLGISTCRVAPSAR